MRFIPGGDAVASLGHRASPGVPQGFGKATPAAPPAPAAWGREIHRQHLLEVDLHARAVPEPLTAPAGPPWRPAGRAARAARPASPSSRTAWPIAGQNRAAVVPEVLVVSHGGSNRSSQSVVSSGCQHQLPGSSPHPSPASSSRGASSTGLPAGSFLHRLVRSRCRGRPYVPGRTGRPATPAAAAMPPLPPEHRMPADNVHAQRDPSASPRPQHRCSSLPLR